MSVVYCVKRNTLVRRKREYCAFARPIDTALPAFVKSHTEINGSTLISAKLQDISRCISRE